MRAETEPCSGQRRRPRSARLPAAVAAAAASALLLGCAARTEKLPPPVDPPPAFSPSGTAALEERWWTSFGDERLDELVEIGLEENFDLAAAWERLRAATALARRERADLYPQLTGSAESVLGEGGAASERQDELVLGLTASYEVDLWGRIRSAAEAERLRARASLNAYRTAALTLSAEIARTWFRLAEARDQVALLERQLETNESMLGLMESRFGTGLVRAADVLRQRGLAESSRERLALERGRRDVLEHRLAVLLGRPPQEPLPSDSAELPVLPPLPDAGLPAELVRRRPDVRGAFELLQAADRDLATAISEQYPRLDLSVSASTASGGADELFRDWALSFVGELFAPIFLGGELRAEVDRAEAERRRRLKEYGQAILESFREVEDALVLEARRGEAKRSVERQVELAREAQERLRIEFVHGTSDYLDALTALDELQELQRDLLAARLSVVESRIALHRALAGPIETPRESRAAAGETP